MSSNDFVHDADQVELLALSGDPIPLDRGIADDLMSSTIGDLDLERDYSTIDWVQKDIAVDEAASDCATEIYRRSQLLENSYPL